MNTENGGKSSRKVESFPDSPEGSSKGTMGRRACM